MKEIAVYTTVLGSRSKLWELEFNSSRCDFIAFCHPKVESDTWEVKRATIDQPTYRRCARKYKILSCTLFSEYKYTIWVDASIRLVKDPATIVDAMKESDNVVGWKHPRRSCAYDELVTCLGNNSEIAHPKDQPYLINRFLLKLTEEGFPEGIGMYENGILARRVNNEIKSMEELWWKEVDENTHEDQAVLPYALWKSDMLNKTVALPGKVTDNEYVEYKGHKVNWI